MLKSLIKSIFPRAAWERVARLRWRLEQEVRFGLVWTEAQSIGWNAAIRLLTSRLMDQLSAAAKKQRTIWSIRIPGYRYPFYYRPHSSDASVIHQVFVGKEYDCIGSESNIAQIIDCGANIGSTTFFLLHRYPHARAVVVEPDPDNMRVCRRNLAPFADRVTFVESGVWSCASPMVIERGKYRDGGDWAFQTRPAQPGEAVDFMALTVSDLIAAGGFHRVDLLKMDIEAAEAEVFCQRPQEWLDRTKNLVIELHGPRCEEAVKRSLTCYHFQLELSGELTVFRNMVRNGD